MVGHLNDNSVSGVSRLVFADVAVMSYHMWRPFCKCLLSNLDDVMIILIYSFDRWRSGGSRVPSPTIPHWPKHSVSGWMLARCQCAWPSGISRQVEQLRVPQMVEGTLNHVEYWIQVFEFHVSVSFCLNCQSRSIFGLNNEVSAHGAHGFVCLLRLGQSLRVEELWHSV